MFELPQTKRIRRSELLNSPSPSHSRPNSPRPENTLETLSSILNFEYEYLPPPSPPASTEPTDSTSDSSKKRKRDTNSPPTLQQPEQEEFDFPLFSHTRTVALRDTPPPPPSQLGLYLESYTKAATCQKRPQSYYFHSGLPKSHLTPSTVISGEQVLVEGKPWEQGGLYWPGFTLPWKLITIPVSSSTSNKNIVKKHVKGIGKCKPSKKRRIILRKEKLKMVEEKKRKEEEEKEKKEKRTIRNRERKIKKRMKEKEKVAAWKVEGVDEGNRRGEAAQIPASKSITPKGAIVG